MTTRKDQLTGARSVVTGLVELAMATDRSADTPARRLNAAFGATSVLTGIGRLRGAMPRDAFWVSAKLLATARMLLSVVQVKGGVTRTPPLPAFDEPWEAVSRTAKLDAVNKSVSGAFTVAIAAADESLERRQRLPFALIGVSSIAGGIGTIRRERPVVGLAGLGYVVAIGYAVVAAVGQRRRRRRSRWRRAVDALWSR